MALIVPERLAAACRKTPERSAWLERLPDTLRELERRWSLTLGTPFGGEEVSCAWVAPVARADGTSAVLKLGMPHMEGENEPDGLLLLESGERVAIELELTPKRATLYKDILADYERQIRDEHVDGLRFYSASRKNMARVRELSKKHRLLNSRAEFMLYEPVLERRR